MGEALAQRHGRRPGRRGRLRLPPAVGDVALSLLVLGVALIPFVVGRQSRMLATDPTGVLVTATVVATALLPARRHRPGPTWVATSLVGLLAVAAGSGPTTAYVPAAVALYTVSTRSSTGRAVAAGVAAAAAPVVVILAVGGHGAFDAVAFGMTAWSGVALMSGIAVRNQRAVVEAAHERARMAETTREEEAQRRVTEERLRIARELHDVMAHHVSVINVQAGVAGHLVHTDPDSAAAALAHVREASQTVLREVAQMLGLLRADGDELETSPSPGLADLDALLERARRAGVQVAWHTTGPLQALAPTVDLTAYRVVQEALTNAARHGSGVVRVRVHHAADAVTFDISNRRARPHAPAPPGRHGLAGMHERVLAVGGTLVAGPDAADSWSVLATLPVAAPAAGAVMGQAVEAGQP